VQVVVDANGAVTGANSVSGVHELREAVLQSVFDWHFAKDWASGTRQVIVTFELQKDAAAKLQDARRATLRDFYARHASPFANRVIKGVVVSGLSEQAKADLLARLPVHVGDTLTEDVIVNVHMAIQDVHLGFVLKPDEDGVDMWIEPQSEFGYEAAGGGGASSYRPEGNITADQFMVDNSDLYTSSTSVLKSITVSGISDAAKADLLRLLPVHEGDTLPAKISGVMDKVGKAVARFDRRLHVGINIHNGVATMRISPDEATSSGNVGGGVAGAGGAPGLALHVEPSGADLLLTWNKSGETIADAAHGVLSISDGDRHEHLDMDANQLRTGSIVWAPVTGDVTFKLEVTGKNQTTTIESLRSTRPSPVPDGTSTNANPAAPEIAKPAPSRVRVGSNVQASLLISRAEPVYPPLAKQAQIQGTVELSALIGKDGRVQNLMVVRGHPLLVQAALDAVRNWVYEPTLIDGEPVEVEFSIDVNFTLPPSERANPNPSVISRVEPDYPPAAGSAETPKRIRVGGNVQQAKLVSKVPPRYPKEAKDGGIQGTVKLQVVLGKDGRVEDIKVLSGEPVLAAAALEAVKDWVYTPTLINGEPVEVQTLIDVNFVLQ